MTVDWNLNHYPWWYSAFLGGAVVLFFEGLAILFAGLSAAWRRSRRF